MQGNVYKKIGDDKLYSFEEGGEIEIHSVDALNGLTLDTLTNPDSIKLGGTLTENTEIKGPYHFFIETNASGTIDNSIGLTSVDGGDPNYLARIHTRALKGGFGNLTQIKLSTQRSATSELGIDINGDVGAIGNPYGIIIKGDSSVFKGIQYDANFSINYNDRSIPDVEWVSKQIQGARSFQFSVARNSNSVGSDQDLRRQNGTATNNSPYIIPFNCKLVSISAGTNPTAGNVSWNLQILKNNSVEQTLSINNNTKAYSDGYSNTFVAGDEIRFRADYTGDTLSYPGATARFLETN